MKEYKKIDAFKLKDEELKMISGGSEVQYMKMVCPHCGKINNVNVMDGSYKCNHCKTLNVISG